MAVSATELAIILSAKDAASKVVGGLAGKFGELGAAGKLAAAGAATLVTAGAALLGGLTKLAQESAHTAGEVAKFKRETGLTAIEASKLVAIGKRLGVDTEELSKSFGKLSVSLESAHPILEKYNIATAKTRDGHIDMEKTLGNIADRFKSMPDGVEKTAIAMNIFGKTGKDMIPILNQGSDGLKAMGDQAARMGLVFDEKALASAKRYSMAQKDLQENVEGLKNKIGLAFLPVLADASTGLVKLADLVLPPVAAGLERVTGFVRIATGVFKDMVAAVQGKQLGGGDFLASIIGANSAANFMAMLTQVGAAVAEFWQQKAVPAFNYLKAEVPVVWTQVKDAIVTAWHVVEPVISAGITKLEELGHKFEELPPKLKDFVIAAAVAGTVNHTLGDPVGDVIQKFSYLAQGVGGLTEGGIPGLISKIGALGLVLGSAGLLGALSLLFVAWTEDWGQIREKTATSTDNIKAFLGGVASAFQKQTSETLPAYANAFADVEMRAINPFREKVDDLAQRALPRLSDAIEDNAHKAAQHRDEVTRAHEAMTKWEERGRRVGEMFQWLGEHVIGPVLESMANQIAYRFDQIMGAIEGVINLVKIFLDLIDKASHIPNPFANAGPSSTPNFNAVGYGQYATGTPFVPRTGPAIVHRGEAIFPADQNPFTRGGGGGQDVHEIHVYLDGREIDASVQRKQRQTQRRYGVVLDPSAT